MTKRLRLGVLSTHPIQYQAPLFRRLAQEDAIDLRVFFAHAPSGAERGVGFGVSFDWDIDLTSGYQHEWLTNVARRPGLDHFRGCDTPDVGRRIAAGGFDAFLVSGWHALSYWQAIAACTRAGVPMLVRGDSQVRRSEPLLKRAVRDAVYPLLVGRFAVCLAVGTRSEAYFRRYGAREVVRAPHFVDNEFFALRARGARRMGATERARLQVPDDCLLVLVAGKLQPKKRPLDVIRAAAVARRAADVRVQFVGDGELRAACEEEAVKLNVPTYFSGFLNQTEIPRAYAGADVLALASDEGETWGLVVNEAMACGVPALVSRAAGCEPDLIVEGKTGYGFDCGDVAALGRSMVRMAVAASDRRALGTAAGEHVKAYSVDAAAGGIVMAARLAARA